MSPHHITVRRVLRSAFLAGLRLGELNDAAFAGALLSAHSIVEDAIDACPMTKEKSREYLVLVLDEETEIEKADTLRPAALAASR